jgi:putative redox protein
MFTITAASSFWPPRGHQIVADQPPEEGGSDAGMTPPELFLASLGSCAAYYEAEYLRTRNLRADGLHVHVSGVKGGQPARIAEIEIEVHEPFDFDDKIRQGLKASVRRCLIHNTLIHPFHIGIRVCESSQETLVGSC